MFVYNYDLYRVLGIQFSFKQTLSDQLPFFTWTVSAYDEPGNTPEIRDALTEKVIKCGPAMGFAEKQYVYELLKLIFQAADDMWSTDPEPYDRLTKALLSVEHYSGIAGEEDFNFMVAVFNFLEAYIGAYGA